MATFGWGEIVTAALGSGLAIKATDIAYQEWQRRRDRKSKARAFLDENLDPLLKAADEVVGKVRSLAERDMQGLVSIDGPLMDSEVTAVAYLLSVFWSRVEILRAKSLYVEVSRTDAGKRLLQFLDCLESQRVRILGRSRQRALGELLTDRTSALRESIAFTKFVSDMDDGTTRRWFDPLFSVLEDGKKPGPRQRILLYATVLHALIDTLDPQHRVTRDRPGFANKLNLKSRKNLQFRVFRVYLPFVRKSEKYWEQPSSKRPKGP